MSTQLEIDDFFNSKPKNVAAWQLKAKERPVTVSNAPYTPAPRDHVTIQVVDVAINPIDWKIQDEDLLSLEYPAILGMDVAGEVVETGKGVDEYRTGQRVIANCSGYNGDATQGAFQKFVNVHKDAVAELPYTIPTSQGVVLPLGISTAAAGLYQKGFLGLPYPRQDSEPLKRSVVVWGGAGSVGSCCIQLATASGAKVIAIASSDNFDYCKKLGASECFDYHDKDVEKQIIKALKDKTVAGAFHAVSSVDALESCARIVDESKGKAIVATLMPGAPLDNIPSSVRVSAISAMDIFKGEVGAKIWREFLPYALEKGIIVPKPDPLIVGEQLRAVQAGLDKQRKGVSAAKVVVTNISQGNAI